MPMDAELENKWLESFLKLQRNFSFTMIVNSLVKELLVSPHGPFQLSKGGIRCNSKQLLRHMDKCLLGRDLISRKVAEACILVTANFLCSTTMSGNSRQWAGMTSCSVACTTVWVEHVQHRGLPWHSWVCDWGSRCWDTITAPSFLCQKAVSWQCTFGAVGAENKR